MSAPSVEDRARLRAHYELECRLARRLKEAPAAERPRLYARIYDELHRELERLGLGRQIESNPPGQTRLLLRLLEPFLHPETVFLDFGAGNGALASAVSSRVERVIAVDDHPELLDVARNSQNLEVLSPGALATTVADSSIDLALSCHVVEHLHPDDLRPHLLEIRDLLRPGGRYLVITPNRLLGPHDVSRFFSDTAEGLHLCEYDYRSLAAALRAAGFSRVAAVRGLGRRQAGVPVGLVVTLESLLGLLPRTLRHRVLSSFGSSPLRPLEQVKLVAVR